jgi:zinc D-Ala-D-Ala carboxypeptidase
MPQGKRKKPKAKPRSTKSKTRHRLSKHFVIEEFDCRDGTKVKPREYNGLQYLCRQFLEPMRAQFGPCTVHSGYRTVNWNKHVGGEPNSFHIYTMHDGNDQAADVSFARGGPNQWAAFANNIRRKKRGGRGGLGIYSTFVHIDIRDYPANWRG